MFENVLTAAKLFTMLGCGVMAGLFFAFSNFVMNALARVPDRVGIAAMQSINVTVQNPLFMLLFLGTAITSLFLIIVAVRRWQEPGMVYLLAGSLLYFVGCVLVTIIFNVPLNDALAAVDPNSAQGAELWKRYLQTWVAWNHVRTVSTIASLVTIAVGLMLQRRIAP